MGSLWAGGCVRGRFQVERVIFGISEEADGVAAHTAPERGAAGYSFQSCQSLKPHH